MRREFAVVVMLGLAACATSTPTNSSGVASNSGNEKNPPAADVKVANCSSDSTIGSATAELTIVNHSSKRSNYTAEVAFLDASGAQIGSGFAAENNIDAGQTAKTEAVDFVKGDVAKCQVKEVQRYAS